MESAAPRAAAPAAAPPAPGKGPSVDLGDDLDAFDEVIARKDLWQRLRSGFALPDLQGELVAQWERWYAARPDYVRRMTERGARYLFHIVEEVERRGMPTDLALLPFIESAFNPTAVSSARAMGMWQFMPGTGKDFDLRQNLFRDDRRDVLASTRAALDYLQQLHARFGDWHLALAAYNWGQGNVQRAVARNQSAGRPADYLRLRMPEETRHYVPKLQAVKNIVRDPARFGLSLPALENHPFFVTVPIERDIDLALAARLAGMALDDFKELNPQHNKPVILAAGTPRILLPFDNALQFRRELQAHRGALSTWTAWVAPRTLRPGEAADKLGVAETTLREVNRIPSHMLVKAGSTLLVPRADGQADDVSEHLAHNAQLVLAPEGAGLRRSTLRIGRLPERLADVAHRLGVSAADLARWNKTTATAVFKPGQVVVVMQPARGTTADKPRRSAQPTPAKRPHAASTGGDRRRSGASRP